MSVLSFVRLMTLLIVVPTFVAAFPDSWAAWIQVHLCNSASIYESYDSPLQAVGHAGVCLTAPVAAILAFAAMPRFSWSVSVLSWCLLLLGACELLRLETGLATKLLCIWTQITGYAWELYLALAPLLLGGFLRYHFVQEHIVSLSRQNK